MRFRFSLNARSAFPELTFLGLTLLVASIPLPVVGGAEVIGRVRMTDVCSPGVSPAVAYLEPIGPSVPVVRAGNEALPNLPDDREANQQPITLEGFHFLPRVRALVRGQRVRFVNREAETHRLRIDAPLGPTARLEPGDSWEYVAELAGPTRVVCDLHPHMRGFLIVSPSPWYSVCTVRGEYRIVGVPPGKYLLTVWHEMGEPSQREITVPSEGILKVPLIMLTVDLTLGSLVRKEIQSDGPFQSPPREWSEVVDRVSVLLAAALDDATRPDGTGRAVRMLEDAYWGDYEGSDMEAAVREHLGFERSAELAEHFRGIRDELLKLIGGEGSAAAVAERNRRLLIALMDVRQALCSLGIPDNSTFRERSRSDFGSGTSSDPPAAGGGSPRPIAATFQTFKRKMHFVQFEADRLVPEDAVAAFDSVCRGPYQALRREFARSDPSFAEQLDRRLNATRGELAMGLKGEELLREMETLQSDLERRLSRLESSPNRAPAEWFGSAFETSLGSGGGFFVLLALMVGLPKRGGSEDGGRRRAPWVGSSMGLVAGFALGWAIERLPVEAGGTWSRIVLGGLAVLASFLIAIAVWIGGARENGSNRAWGWLAVALGILGCRVGAMTVMVGSLFLEGESRAGGRAAVLGGFVAGLAVLVLLPLASRAAAAKTSGTWTRRLAVGVLVFLMLALYGQGVFALQSVGVVGTSPLRWLSSEIPQLGIFASEQVVLGQIGLVAGIASLLVRSSLSDRRQRDLEAAEVASLRTGSAAPIPEFLTRAGG
jgi:high-affinity iron transporter